MARIIALFAVLGLFGVNPFKLTWTLVRMCLHVYCLFFTVPFYGLIAWWIWMTW